MANMHVQKSAEAPAAGGNALAGRAGMVEPQARKMVRLVLEIYKYSDKVWRYAGVTLPEEGALRMKRALEKHQEGSAVLDSIIAKEFPELPRIGRMDPERYEQYMNIKSQLLRDAELEGRLVSQQYCEEMEQFYFAAPAGAHKKHDVLPVGIINAAGIPEFGKLG